MVLIYFVSFPESQLPSSSEDRPSPEGASTLFELCNLSQSQDSKSDIVIITKPVCISGTLKHSFPTVVG